MPTSGVPDCLLQHIKTTQALIDSKITILHRIHTLY